MNNYGIYKRIWVYILCGLLFLCIPSIFCACTDNNKYVGNVYDGELLRLHIRANSNSELDQSVKLAVRDAVNTYIVETLRPSSFESAYLGISLALSDIAKVCETTLSAHGFNYSAAAKLTTEYFPARMYGDVTVREGEYKALIVELGEAKGDNWWCVVYPPLCYGDSFEYRSFFAELFSK